jgi:hypothetical protein
MLARSMSSKFDLSFLSDHRSADDSWNYESTWFLRTHVTTPRNELQTESLYQRLWSLEFHANELFDPCMSLHTVALNK